VNKIQVLDLFSGIGGFSLGLERAGFETVAFCEIDKYCRLVLQKHWKDIKIYSDVREITRQQYEQDGLELPEIITGGFPCQPFSVAGRQKGSRDNRYLWPEMFRIIKEFKPRWIIAENVRGIINIQDGVVFEGVHADLESQGYETQTFNIPAAGVGAPHRRERVWIVGYSEHNGSPSTAQSRSTSTTGNNNTERKDTAWKFKGTSGSENREAMANSRRTIRGKQSTRNKESIGSGTPQKTEWSIDSDSLARPSEREKIMADPKRVYVQGQHDGSGKEQSRRGGWWEVEPNVGRVADGLPGRVHRLKGLGNSIVPQIAEEIGKAILKVDLIDRDSKA
jgi:DNA (cytosine-5)-methyltransferase 1